MLSTKAWWTARAATQESPAGPGVKELAHAAVTMSDAATPPMDHWVPLAFLILSAPVIVDLVFGATQLTTIVALVPEVLTYGCAAALIRTLARRQGASWTTIIAWGVAFAVISECLIVQTSLAPLAGLQPHPRWGRAVGVNWPYLTWALGYISVWGIAMSIQLTELVFPAHRSQPWLGRRGQYVLAVIFAAGSFVAWHTWTQVVVPRFLHQPPYHPPAATLGAAAVVAGVVIVAGGYLCRRHNQHRIPPRPHGRAPTPPAVGVVSFVAGGLWFVLTVLPASLTAVTNHVPAVGPLVLALGEAVVASTVYHRWSTSPSWSDHHRLAVITGALTASMAAGFISNTFPTTVDLVGKIVMNVAVLVGLMALNRRLGRRNSGRVRSKPPAVADASVRE